LPTSDHATECHNAVKGENKDEFFCLQSGLEAGWGRLAGLGAETLPIGPASHHMKLPARE
jgi:hypothetical protein